MHLNQYVHRPTLGMRNIKTALTAALCALIYYFVGRSPAFACIGAIYGMGHDMDDAFKNGFNRLFGTIIGGMLGMVLFHIYLQFVPDGHHTLGLVGLTFLGCSLLVMLCQVFWVGGVQPGGVVLCILLFNTPADSYVTYALNRILDTGVGVVLALGVSWVFPMNWQKVWPQRIQRWNNKQ